MHEGGTCRRSSFSAPENLHPNIMEVNKGYWPSPDPEMPPILLSVQCHLHAIHQIPAPVAWTHQ